MKKISIISILSVLIVPAFAQPEAKDLYGDPANIQQAVAPKTDVQPMAEQQPVAETQPVAEQVKEQPVDSKEIKEAATEPAEVKEQKIEEKKVEKTEEKKAKKQKSKKSQVKEKKTEVQEEQPVNEKIEEQKIETKTTSNPNAKFPNGLQFGLGVSPTSGLNAFVGYNNKKFDSFWWKRFGVRLDFATYSPIKNRLNRSINSSIGDDGIKIDDNLKVNNVNINAKHFGALVDFYPFGDTWFLGGLRVSGGYMSGNMNLNADIKGKFDGTDIEFEIGGKKYSYSGKDMLGKANVNWKYSGPYLGTGFDLGIFRGFKLYMDAGVVFADNHAKADLNVPLDGLKDVASGLPVEGNAALEEIYENAKAKALADAQKEMDKVNYFPIVKLGFMYRF